MKPKNLLVLAMLLTGTVSAQTLTVGNTPTTPNSSDANLGAVRTAVDLTHPANATGSLDTANFSWSTSGCTAAAKVKVFRRVGDNFTLVAERGPFDVSTFSMTVTLSPAIPVLQGDLIGLARVASCGNPGAVSPGYDASFIEVAGDATSFSYSPSAVYGNRLQVSATGTATEVVAGVIPSVASNPGRGGAYFRTLVQALAPYSFAPVSGKFVFRKKGTPGGPTDVSMPFAVAGGSVESWTDLLNSMGATGNPGSIDVVLPWGASTLLVGAQVYNDQGNGTTGFREELIPTINHGFAVGTNIFFSGATGYMFGPANANTYRANIAVRSLDAGVEATFQVYHADGTAAGSAHSLRYPPNTWDQDSWAVMTGVALEDGAYVRISVSRGSAIFEVSIVDNITNDPADVVARVLGAVI
jgi:hypothetical protein